MFLIGSMMWSYCPKSCNREKSLNKNQEMKLWCIWIFNEETIVYQVDIKVDNPYLKAKTAVSGYEKRKKTNEYVVLQKSILKKWQYHISSRLGRHERGEMYQSDIKTHKSITLPWQKHKKKPTKIIKKKPTVNIT